MSPVTVKCAACVVSAALVSLDAHADAACTSPWVLVSVAGIPPQRALDFTQLLRAELASRHISVCESGVGAPIASIVLSANEDGANLDVEVHDALTRKRVRRDVPLASLPADGVPLALALSADELLRASWAELAMTDAPAPALPIPVEVTRVNAESLVAQPTPRRASFALAGALEHYSTGTTLFGADVVAGVRVLPRLRLSLRFGARGGPSLGASDGRISVRALVGGVAGALTLTPVDHRVGLDGVLRCGVVYATFGATPNPLALGRELSDWAVLGEGGLTGWITLAPAVRVATTWLASVPLRSVRPTDAGAAVGGVAGIGVAGSVDFVGMF